MSAPQPRRLTTPMAASIGAAVLILVLVLSFAFSSGLWHERKGVSLPADEPSAPIDSAGGQVLTVQSVANVEITPQNAKQVIASLVRPAQYSMEIENTLYYTGGSTTLRAARYARDGAVRTDTLSASGTVESSVLRAGDVVYAWNAGDATPYRGAWGAFSEDAAAMLPSAEDALGEDVTVSAAARMDADGEPCIRVVFDRQGYRCEYAVSAVSGLLHSAAFYQGETLTRRVVVSEQNTDAPDPAHFALPSGRSVLGES